ncbi:hypothetical protein I79_013135 [Cricetulus griseus]|uniref:Uncharacterized protein n=1 Tax=Cricetulus griseus TaxID=10029 RepID=G3HQN0_CRIGR|nr:hypothetical protein I79_013135 [Cricetulus griseus]
MQGKDKEAWVAPEGALELSHTSVGEARVPSHGTVMDHSSPRKACDLEQGGLCIKEILQEQHISQLHAQQMG